MNSTQTYINDTYINDTTGNDTTDTDTCLIKKTENVFIDNETDETLPVLVYEKAILDNNIYEIMRLMASGTVPTENEYNLVCEKGLYDILKLFTMTYGMKATSVGADYACRNGYLTVLQFLLNYKIYPSENGMEEAVINHQFRIIDYLMSTGFRPTENMLLLACQTNQLYFMFYFIKLGVKITEECVDNCIQGNYLKNLEFLYSYGGMASDTGFKIACFLGYSRIIDFLISQGFRMTEESGFQLLAGRHVELFYRYQPPLTMEMMYQAVEMDDFELLEWIYDHGIVPNETVLNYAAYYGNKEQIQFLINIGILPTSETIKMAKLGNNYDLADTLSRQYDLIEIVVDTDPIRILEEKINKVYPEESFF